MSSVIYGCCAFTLLAATACGPRAAASPSHPSVEARNGETEKKTRKQRPVVAPPPAYGNKIVRDGEGQRDVASAGLSGCL
jgi:hypothetical protein